MASLRRRLDSADESGVGMVELLIVMVLMSVVGGVLVDGMVSSFRHQRQQVSYVATLNTLKLAFERTTGELRAADPLVAATPESVTVRIRRGPETARTCADVLFSLAPAGTTANLVTQNPAGAANRTIATGFIPATVAAPTFTYLDENRSTLNPPITVADVQYIKVNLRTTVQGSTAPVHFHDEIFLRNKGGRSC